jgi:hypothetical protein
MKLKLEDNVIGYSSVKVIGERSSQDDYTFSCKITGDLDEEKLLKIYKQIYIIEGNINKLFNILSDIENE